MLTTQAKPFFSGRSPAERPPLYSAWYVPRVMPPVLGTVDLTALFLLNVFWITNVTPLASGGPASFTYWLITSVLFFVPCSLVLAQLAAWYPVAGSILSWTYYALGSRWSFFVGICAWLPGILSMVTASAAVISGVQALNAAWLIPPWQQGLGILGILLFTGLLSTQPLRVVQNVLNVGVGAMGLATLLIVLAAGLWLLHGHPSATLFSDAVSWKVIPGGPQTNLALLGSATLALLGSDMPLSMAGEITHRRVIPRHLVWGTLLTLGGYLLFTWALLVVQGPGAAAATVNPLSLVLATIDQTLGKTAGNAMIGCLLLYFLLIPAALNLCFARLLLVASIDRRVSLRFAHLNRFRVPVTALWTQVSIAAFFTILLYLLAPAITALGNPANLNSEAYNVLGASLLLVWAVSFAFPFIDVAVLSVQRRDAVCRQHLLPLPLLLCCVVTGTALCAGTIAITLFNSFIPTLLPDGTWWYIVGGLALACLALCAMASVFTNSEATWEDLAQDTPDSTNTPGIPTRR
ncbi:MAG: APC family permease [Ktedonobacteraceae bacterium]